MSQQYYYLISGLPGIALDEGRGLPLFKVATDDIIPLLSEEDKITLKLLRTESDIKNLVRITDKLDRPFDPNGNLTEDQLEAALKDYSTLPNCMQCIIAAKKENRQLHPGFAPDDEASIEYYSDLALSPDSFIRAYSKFEMTLRNILAGINARKQKIPVENVVLGSDSVAESIRKSGSPDFGLAAENPWVNKILALPSDDPIESEKRIDQIRWSVMDELSAFAGFGATVVFVFVLKLRSAERWKMLSADIGKSFTEKLVADTRMKLEELIRL